MSRLMWSRIFSAQHSYIAQDYIVGKDAACRSQSCLVEDIDIDGPVYARATWCISGFSVAP